MPAHEMWIDTLWGTVWLGNKTQRRKWRKRERTTGILTVWGFVRFKNPYYQARATGAFRLRKSAKKAINPKGGFMRCPVCGAKDTNMDCQNGVCFDCYRDGYGMLVPTGTAHMREAAVPAEDEVADNISRAYEESLTMVEEM